MKWSKPDKGKHLFAGSLLVLLAIVLLITDYTKPKIKSEKDLVTIEGKLLDYNFVKGNKGYRNYTIKLNNYTNTFKIDADFIKYFSKASFEEHAYNIGKVKISISKKDSILLNSQSNKRIFIFFLKSDDNNYLNEKETIKEHNNRLVIYASLFLS